MRRPVCSGRSDPEWLNSGSLAGLGEDSDTMKGLLLKDLGEGRGGHSIGFGGRRRGCLLRLWMGLKQNYSIRDQSGMLMDRS